MNSSVKFFLWFLTIFGTHFDHSTWMKVNDIKPRGILCSNRPIFSLKPTYHTFRRNFEWIFTFTLTEWDNIPQNIARNYSFVRILNEIFCPILSISSTNDFSFVYFPDLNLKFKILILVFSNSKLKTLKFNIPVI